MRLGKLYLDEPYSFIVPLPGNAYQGESFSLQLLLHILCIIKSPGNSVIRLGYLGNFTDLTGEMS